jgi:hypothetical protein
MDDSRYEVVHVTNLTSPGRSDNSSRVCAQNTFKLMTAGVFRVTNLTPPESVTTLRHGRLLASMGMGTGGGDTVYLKSKPGMPLWGWRVGIPQEYNVAELSDEVGMYKSNPVSCKRRCLQGP